MTDTNTPITDLAHQRDSDGALLPVEKTVAVRGEGEATVELYPATSGQRREWRRRFEADAESGEELDDDLQADLFDEFLPYEPSDFGDADAWSDIRPALEDALANAIFAELFDTEQDEFGAALDEAMAEVQDAEGNPEPSIETPEN